MKVPEDTFDLISGLPGEEFIATGLRDLEKGIYTSVDALLILIAKTRLEKRGLHCLKDLKGMLPVNPVSGTFEK